MLFYILKCIKKPNPPSTPKPHSKKQINKKPKKQEKKATTKKIPNQKPGP